MNPGKENNNLPHEIMYTYTDTSTHADTQNTLS